MVLTCQGDRDEPSGPEVSLLRSTGVYAIVPSALIVAVPWAVVADVATAVDLEEASGSLSAANSTTI